MGERITQPSTATVDDALAGASQARAADARRVIALMTEVTGADPVIWGTSIVGFGRMPYTTADGKQHEWFAIGVAARKAALTLYGLTFYGSNLQLLEALGPHTTGKGCLYIKRLDEVDAEALERLIRHAWDTNHRPADAEG